VFDASQLLSFLAAVVALVLSPGPNTVLILSQTLAGGRAVGLATVAGVEAGTLVHTLAAALGLSAVLSTSALAFDLVKYVGVAYFVVLGVQALRKGSNPPAEVAAPRLQLSRAFRRALLTNVANPKVALFFLALLPQFVHAERGAVLVQFLALGLIVSAVGICFGSALALAAGRVNVWLRSAAYARWESRITGSVFLALGARLAFEQHR
jgi:threonine/homoserine/homoserine lactone efflux protein